MFEAEKSENTGIQVEILKAPNESKCGLELKGELLALVLNDYGGEDKEVKVKLNIANLRCINSGYGYNANLQNWTLSTSCT